MWYLDFGFVGARRAVPFLDMHYDPDKHHRRSIRLADYDYKQSGAYFITVCAKHRQCLFGEIADGEMRLNELGRAVEECWEWLAQRYQQVSLDAWIIMPNHLHGVIVLDDFNKGGSRTAPTPEIRPKPLGRLIGAFKTVSTKKINVLRRAPGAPVWQRNYYEHVIRSEDEWHRIRTYIEENPLKWDIDQENPAAPKPGIESLGSRGGSRTAHRFASDVGHGVPCPGINLFPAA